MQYSIYLHISISNAFNIRFKYESIKNEYIIMIERQLALNV
jgi:hypothetical protein